jgi:hypothetical protein
VCSSCGIQPSDEPSTSSLLFAQLEKKEKLVLRNQATALELSHRTQQALVDDITGVDALDRKCVILNELKLHLTTILAKHGVLTAKIAQPLAADGLYVNADHQENFMQLVGQLTESFDWGAAEDDIRWGGRQPLEHNTFVSPRPCFLSSDYELISSIFRARAKRSQSRTSKSFLRGFSGTCKARPGCTIYPLTHKRRG